MCLANANRLVKCFKKPLGLENKFRKRNFDAILSITGELGLRCRRAAAELLANSFDAQQHLFLALNAELVPL